MSPAALARALFALACLLAPLSAAGQSLRDLALGWPVGDYRSPLVCVIDGSPRQALRRVRLDSPPPGERPALRVLFHALAAPLGTTCTGVTGETEPELVGSLELVFDGRTRPDTGTIDFKNAMRRDGGFRYRVASDASLRSGSPGASDAELVPVDLAGAEAWIRAVSPGSDAARRLASFGGRRQLELELLLPGRPSLRFDLVDLPGR